MAVYTIELRSIIDSGRDIFKFPYPFYADDSEKRKFEERFIKHFYFREIGAETIDRFVWNLEDKFNTVFPYYNELFKATQIKYSVLDNYLLTETTTTERENRGRSSGTTSNVGRVMDDQTTETADNMTGTGEVGTTENGTTKNVHSGTSETTGTTSETVTTSGTSNTSGSGTSKTSENSSSDVTSKETVVSENTTSSTTKTEGETDTSEDTKNVKKFLETPSGIVSIDQADYLTNITQDNGERNGNTTTSETVTSTGSGTTDTETNGTVSTDSEKTTSGSTSETSETETTGTEKRNGTNGSNTTVNDTTNGTTTGTSETSSSMSQDSTGTVKHTGEQKTTNDSNTRSETEGSHREKMEVVRKGNIGVDSDADMIQKHIKLQEILRKIEIMFFDECEDLFMMVY